jgi:hypothetical protein
MKTQNFHHIHHGHKHQRLPKVTSLGRYVSIVHPSFNHTIFTLMNLDPITPSKQGSPTSQAVAPVDTNPSTISIEPEEPPTIQFTTPQALAESISKVTGDALYVRDIREVFISYIMRIPNILKSLGVNTASFQILWVFRSSRSIHLCETTSPTTC